MLKQLSQRPTALNSFLIVFVSLLVAAFIGIHIGAAPLTFQDLITGFGLISAVIILTQKRGLEIGFIIWIMIFGLGFRSIRIPTPIIFDQIGSGGTLSQKYLTTGSQPALQIHPLFIVIL